MHTKITYMLATLFIYLIPAVIALGQPSEVPIVLNYDNSSGEKGITIFEYDGNGKLIKARWQLRDTSRWSTNYYIYNNKNQLLEKYREFSDGITSSVIYRYNEQGNKVSEKFSRSDGVSGESVFKYNKDGVLEKIHCNKYKGWFDGEIRYYSDKDKKLIKGDLLRDNNKTGTIQFSYTKDGQLKTEKWITPNWNQTLSWDYIKCPKSFTSSNVFIRENSRFRLYFEGFSFNQETGGPSYFEYSEDGKLIQKTFERSDNLTTETFFEYDNDGLLTRSFRNYNNGKAAEFTYEFNKNRKLVKRRGKFPDEIFSYEEYFYSENGILLKAIWKNFDNWLSGEITFTHDHGGNLNSGVFKGEEFNATIDFQYNEFGNLAEIVWNFSFRKTQSYHFEYQDLFYEQYF